MEWDVDSVATDTYEPMNATHPSCLSEFNFLKRYVMILTHRSKVNAKARKVCSVTMAAGKRTRNNPRCGAVADLRRQKKDNKPQKKLFRGAFRNESEASVMTGHYKRTRMRAQAGRSARLKERCLDVAPL